MNKKLNNIKLIILDIDKTITDSNNKISEYTKKILQTAISKGIYVVLCSGRTNSYVMEKSKTLEITPIVISSNGSLIYDYKEKKSIHIDELSPPEIEEILFQAQKYQISCKLNAITTRFHNDLVEEKDRDDCQPLQNLHTLLEPIVQVYAYNGNYESIRKFMKKIENNYNIANSSSNLVKRKIKDDSFYWLDIIKKNNSKGNAINKLIKYLKLKKEETICFGDHINDFSMFEACGINCAVGNAMEELKREADYITLPSEDDGVAKFIQENILEIS